MHPYCRYLDLVYYSNSRCLIPTIRYWTSTLPHGVFIRIIIFWVGEPNMHWYFSDGQIYNLQEVLIYLRYIHSYYSSVYLQ